MRATAETLVLSPALRRTSHAYSVVLLGVLILSGCATLPNGRDWGEDATVTPGWQKVRHAAVNAVESPRFWGPLAAAAVFQVGGWDRRVSNWARGHTPVFGSEQNATTWSDRLRTASSYVYFASVLAMPSGSDPKEWVLDKLRGTAVGLVAIGVTDEESLLLKNAAARERPNGQDTQSMPSSHTSRSAVLTELAERNLQSLDLAPTIRRVLEFGLDALTYSTAWARVEAGFHFPSDTLVGMSLGNFNGALFNDAFMGLKQSPSRLSFSMTPLPGGAALSVQVGF
jgi:membrane-associated phospholipid phosphatase